MKKHFSFIILAFLANASLLYAGKNHKLPIQELAVDSFDNKEQQVQKSKVKKEVKPRVSLSTAFEKPCDQQEKLPETNTVTKKWVSQKKSVTIKDIEEKYRQLKEQYEKLDKNSSPNIDEKEEAVETNTAIKTDKVKEFDPRTATLQTIRKEYDYILSAISQMETDEEKEKLHRKMEALSALINGHKFPAKRPKKLPKEKFQELKEVLIDAATNMYLQAQEETPQAVQEKKKTN